MKKKIKIYSTNEVIALLNKNKDPEQKDCKPRTAQKWAAANNVKFTGSGKRKDYQWMEADIKRFKERPRPGRRWPPK